LGNTNEGYLTTPDGKEGGKQERICWFGKVNGMLEIAGSTHLGGRWVEREKNTNTGREKSEERGRKEKMDR